MRFGPEGNDWPFPRLRSIGRRGAYLLSKGTLYFLYGWGLLVSERDVPYFAVLHRIAPQEAWAAIWIVVGAVALVAAFLPWCRKFHLEPIAFGGLMAMATIWSVGVIAVYVLPGPQGEAPWIVASLFGSLMASTAVVAGWEEC